MTWLFRSFVSQETSPKPLQVQRTREMLLELASEPGFAPALLGPCSFCDLHGALLGEKAGVGSWFRNGWDGGRGVGWRGRVWVGCGWVWVGVGGCGWVWVGVGGCGWVWVGVGVGEARRALLSKSPQPAPCVSVPEVTRTASCRLSGPK